MTAPAITGSSLTARLLSVIDYAMAGTLSADGCACGEDGCAHLAGDYQTLDEAFRAVGKAAGDDEALAAYVSCWLTLTGIPAREWGVQIVPVDRGDVR